MKDKNLAALLALFLGSVGAHKFYLGQIGWGIVYFVFCWTFIPQLVAFVEFIMLAVMDEHEFNRRFNGSNMLGAPVVYPVLPPAGYQAPGYPFGAAPRGYGPQSHSAGTPDLVTQLEKLNELRIAGLLTDEEFQQQKRKLLDQL